MMIRFEPMNDEDFAAFLRKSIPEYAYDQTRAGNWTSREAMGKARAEFQQMLPNGPQTPNQHLRVMFNDKGHKVGMAWYFVDRRGERPKAFLLDFFFFSEDRHKGYEKEAFAALEAELRAQGVQRIELQVFSHRTDEIALYQNNGFAQASVFFAKTLSLLLLTWLLAACQSPSRIVPTPTATGPSGHPGGDCLPGGCSSAR